MKSLSDGLLLLLDEEVVEEEGVVHARFFLRVHFRRIRGILTFSTLLIYSIFTPLLPILARLLLICRLRVTER